MARTPACKTKLLVTSSTVATEGMPSFGASMPFGGQLDWEALMVKYTPKNAAKNMASEATNRTIPRMGLLVPRTARSSAIVSLTLMTFPRPGRLCAGRRRRAGST